MRPSFATHLNLDLLEENYRRWQEIPESVDSELVGVFRRASSWAICSCEMAPRRRRCSRAPSRESPLQTRVDGLVYAYRTLGHTIAELDPLADKRPENPLLTSARTRLQREGPRPAGLVEILPGQQRDDAARDDRGARMHLRGRDRRGVHAHPESAHPELGAASARIASAEARRLTRDVQIALLRALLGSRSCSRLFCTRATSGKSGFRSRAPSRSW